MKSNILEGLKHSKKHTTTNSYEEYLFRDMFHKVRVGNILGNYTSFADLLVNEDNSMG